MSVTQPNYITGYQHQPYLDFIRFEEHIRLEVVQRFVNNVSVIIWKREIEEEKEEEEEKVRGGVYFVFMFLRY